MPIRRSPYPDTTPISSLPIVNSIAVMIDRQGPAKPSKGRKTAAKPVVMREGSKKADVIAL